MFTGEKPDLLDICPLREDSIYVVGKDGIPQHYDGEDWTPVRTENTNPLMGIWAATEKDIYAVGIGGVVLHVGTMRRGAFGLGEPVHLRFERRDRIPRPRCGLV